jgi:hypothetical protein
VKIEAKELNKLLENVLLFTNKKAVGLQEVFFAPVGDTLSAYSCDDYISLGDSVKVLETDPKAREFVLSIEDAESLLAWVKKDKKVVHKNDIQIRFYNTYLKVDSEGDMEKFTFVKEPAFERWDLVFQLLDEDQVLVPFSDFAVRPERLVRMGQIKAEKEAPIHLRGFDINGHLLVQFKKGKTVVGAIRPVDTSYVSEEFLWPNTEA